MSTILDEMGPLDWEGNFRAAADASQTALRNLAAEPEQLRALIYNVEHRPELLSKSERLRLDDKIVLYDALDDQGFRLRLHISKNESHEVAHNHRFSITVLILRGIYYHKLYVAQPPSDGAEVMGDVTPVLLREEGAGACYTMHHTVIESNTTAPGTLSLLMRGPTMKRRALAVERSTNKRHVKYGEADEPARVREAVAMSIEEYRHLVTRVEHLMGWPPQALAPSRPSGSS